MLSRSDLGPVSASWQRHLQTPTNTGEEAGGDAVPLLEGVPHPVHHLGVERELAQQTGEPRLQHFLADVGLRAATLVA
jgi:hypothetical protein